MSSRSKDDEDDDIYGSGGFWHSCVIDKDRIFQIKNNSTDCRLLQPKPFRRAYRIKRVREAKTRRIDPCLVSDGVSFVFVMFG